MLAIYQGATLIADGSVAGGSVVDDLIIDGTGEGDVVRPIGAAGPTVYDRTLIEHSVRFTVERYHGSSAAAEAHRVLVRQRTKNAGALVVERTVDDVIHRYTAAEAHWKLTKGGPNVVGETSVTEYEVTCGPFVYTKTGTGGDYLGDLVFDSLLAGSPAYGIGILQFPAPWNAGVPDDGAISSVTLADMAA